MTPFDELAPVWMQKLMNDLNLTAEQAAGIMGNLAFESNGFKTLHEIGQPEGRGGYGAAQWTSSRREAFFAYCAAHNLDWQSDEANYGYLLTELKGAYKGTIAALQKAGTLEDAVFSVGQTYERPGGTTPTHLPGYNDRLDYGRRALAGAGTGPAPPKPSPAPAPEPPAISAFDRLKAIQVVLGVKPDAAFGKGTWAALNALLEAAGQPGVE